LWSEKYRPNKLEAMVGNEDAREKLVSWLSKWKKGKSAILVGPPGTGKTTTVKLLARSGGLNLVELNASDVRTKSQMSRKLGEAMASSSLLGERTLIFLDEVDGLAGRADYGAVDFIREAVKESLNPIVMAANDPDSDEVAKLSRGALLVHFRPAPPREVELYLSMIASKEGLRGPNMREIVKEAKGDIRYAINALQAGKADRKDTEPTREAALNAFFDASDLRGRIGALRSYPGQPRDKVRDLMTSVLASGVAGEELVNSMKALSDADLLLGRMIRGGDWRLLRYLDAMLASGFGREPESGMRFSAGSVPWPLQLRIWNDSKKVREISGLAGRRLKESARKALVEDFPFMMAMARDERFRDELVQSLNLGEPLATFVTKEAKRK